MKKPIQFKFIALALVSGLIWGGEAAGQVVLTATQQQTVDNEDFTFTFAPVTQSDGAEGTFRIHARGDFSGPGSASGANEFLTWDLEGLLSDTTSPFLGATIIQQNGGNDYEWEQVYVVPGSVLTALTADGSVTIGVDLGTSVDLGFAGEDFVEVTLTYDVPEPATLALLMVCGLGISGRRARRGGCIA